MDANGTHYELLLGEDDWGTCREDGTHLSAIWGSLSSPPSSTIDASFYWDPNRNQLTLWPRLYVFPPPAGTQPLDPADRRGAAADKFGNVYFVDPTRTQVLVTSSGDRTTTTFWPPLPAAAPSPLGGAFGPVTPTQPPAPRVLSGLTVTARHYLVVGYVPPSGSQSSGSQSSGLLVFDLYRGGEPRLLAWPANVPFEPFDMAAAPGGGLLILDAENKRYWTLDADLAVSGRDQGTMVVAPARMDTFQPLAAGMPREQPTLEFPQGNLLGSASPLDAAQPIAIDALPDGSVLILDRGDGTTSWVAHYRNGVLAAPPFPIDAMQPLLPQGAQSPPAATIDFTAQDFTFVPASGTTDPLAGTVLVALSCGVQSLAFTSSSGGGGSFELVPSPDYYPMRSFGGLAVFYANGSAYYDSASVFVPLVTQKRPQFSTTGTLVTRIFDSKIPGCVWHRLILDAAIPLDTSIQIASRTSDDRDALLDGPFLPEPPRLYQRAEGTELPFVALPAGLSSWELLFQQARGRYLQLQITLSGSARSSPRIRALRAYYPRFSYVRKYMPATYTDNDTFGFLDRFMANFEGVLTPIEDRVAAVQELFDPRTAPADALEWLGAWFGVSMDPAWDVLRQRLFLRHAMDLFQWRGTARGIQMALDLVLSPCPCDAIFTNTDSPRPSGTRVVEQFAVRVTPASVADVQSTPSIFGPQAPPGTWTPSQGGGALIALWQAAAAGAGLVAPTTFPVIQPTDAATAAAWTAFTQSTLGFVPSSDPQSLGDQARWTKFLQNRYLSVTALNGEYDTAYASLTDATLPTTLPADGAPLIDWYQFEGIVMPTAEHAHRFRVLIPLPPGISSDLAQQQQQLDLITRLVDLEKPAHTVFDVRFYWAMFSIGQSRLGFDTLLEQGSRMPQLAPAMVLGRGYLLEGHLAPSFPQDATHRDVIGRTPLGRHRTPRRRR